MQGIFDTLIYGTSPKVVSSWKEWAHGKSSSNSHSQELPSIVSANRRRIAPLVQNPGKVPWYLPNLGSLLPSSDIRKIRQLRLQEQRQINYNRWKQLQNMRKVDVEEQDPEKFFEYGSYTGEPHIGLDGASIINDGGTGVNEDNKIKTAVPLGSAIHDGGTGVNEDNEIRAAVPPEIDKSEHI
jgi:hypothetical protein